MTGNLVRGSISHISRSPRPLLEISWSKTFVSSLRWQIQFIFLGVMILGNTPPPQPGPEAWIQQKSPKEPFRDLPQFSLMLLVQYGMSVLWL